MSNCLNAAAPQSVMTTRRIAAELKLSEALPTRPHSSARPPPPLPATRHSAMPLRNMRRKWSQRATRMATWARNSWPSTSKHTSAWLSSSSSCRRSEHTASAPRGCSRVAAKPKYTLGIATTDIGVGWKGQRSSTGMPAVVKPQRLISATPQAKSSPSTVAAKLCQEPQAASATRRPRRPPSFTCLGIGWYGPFSSIGKPDVSAKPHLPARVAPHANNK
mmetsp:Transcript_16212/g.41724  ORF Transcript_16212/g.41724 Transcript_16212/m.41724 type:complete len:219 (+) Transcript_16212:429-1085(+)